MTTVYLLHLTEPLIETDADLLEWLLYVLREVAGLDGYPIHADMRTDGIVIDGDGEVMQAVRTYLL